MANQVRKFMQDTVGIDVSKATLDAFCGEAAPGFEQRSTWAASALDRQIKAALTVLRRQCL
jgi:hypothetical protein